MADRKQLPEITLEINIPVIVKPWQCRAVKTQYGDKLMLVVKEGNGEREIKWLPIDLANDLVTLKVIELGTWPDGNVKYSVRKGAPDIALCKRQAKDDEHPHYQVKLAEDDDGPEIPEPARPTSAPSAHTPVALNPEPGIGPCVTEAVTQVKRIAAGLNIENADDPLVAAALIEATKALTATLYINRNG